MQSAAPGSVAVTGSPAWRAAVLALAAAAIAAAVGWAVGRDGADPVPTALVLVALVVAVAGSAASLCRCPNGRLAWADGRWRFAPQPPGGPASAATPVEGTIGVALDLGRVLLLTLHPHPGPTPPGRLARALAPVRVRWLPVERGAVVGDWHGLRVALAAAGHAP